MPQRDMLIKGSVALGKTFMAQRTLRRILPGMAALFVLVVILCVISAGMIMAALYLLYQTLMQEGWNASESIWAVAAAALAVQAALIYGIYVFYRRLTQAIHAGSAFSALSDITQAFARGFNEGQP